jgi:2-(1,2-epoxy-1,2-dihydrophenyl)acetyl-CoA isomerase
MTVDIARGDGVLRLVLDRPSRRNAVSAEMITTLVRALEAAAVDDELRAIVLTGAGPDFCSGVDWVATNDTGRRPRAGHLTRRTPLQAHRVVQLLHEVQLPVVCAVRGWAVGFGLGLALAADFTVAASTATFWAPFTERGFTPDSGSTWFVPRLVGVARAKELLLLGRRIDGTRAETLGLIHRAVEDDALDAVVEELVAELAAGPTVALGLAKSAIHAALDGPLDRAMAGEVRALELAARTSDFREGLSAFRERRAPSFEGR